MDERREDDALAFFGWRDTKALRVREAIPSFVMSLPHVDAVLLYGDGRQQRGYPLLPLFLYSSTTILVSHILLLSTETALFGEI